MQVTWLEILGLGLNSKLELSFGPHFSLSLALRVGILTIE